MIGYPLAHRISSALSGSNSEIAINIYGTELPQLRLAARKAKEILENMPEVADARANRELWWIPFACNTIRKPWLPTA